MTNENRFAKYLIDNFEAESYSGRGMYGKRCPSIHADYEREIVSEIVMTIFDDIDLTQNEKRGMLELLFSYSSDSMGRGVVIYWRDIEWPENESEEDSD